jgi:hypothetical protein
MMRGNYTNGRRTSAAATAAVIMLLLLTWWARGAADAAQTTSAPIVFGPAPAVVTWRPSWLARDSVRESGVIAVVGSTLIALGAFVRRATDRED